MTPISFVYHSLFYHCITTISLLFFISRIFLSKLPLPCFWSSARLSVLCIFSSHYWNIYPNWIYRWRYISFLYIIQNVFNIHVKNLLTIWFEEKLIINPRMICLIFFRVNYDYQLIIMKSIINFIIMFYQNQSFSKTAFHHVIKIIKWLRRIENCFWSLIVNWFCYLSMYIFK